MKQDVKVSIITVVFNGEKYLQQTIDSVANQTYQNIEYIVIDGGSIDETLNIIKRNQDKISKWISEPDNGLYDAMNKGIKMATGRLIGTINSDDWYELDAVEAIVKAYLQNPLVSIIHSDRYDILPNNKRREFKFNPSAFKFKYFNMTYSHPTMFVASQVYKDLNYNTALKSFSDYQFVLEVFFKNPAAFIHIPKPLVNFRLGGVSGSLGYFEDLKEGFLARKYAGISGYENIFSLFLRIVLSPIVILKKQLSK